jgi:hypothetical protein
MDVARKHTRPASWPDITYRHAALIGLDGLFLGLILLVAHLRAEIPVIGLDLLVFFALATFRLARTISFNEIAEPLRAPFTVVQKDSCGAGANVHPKGSRFQYVVGSLLACPICTGTWSALFLYGTWVVYEPVGRALIYVLAFAGASEILHWTAQLAEWAGRQARCVSGMISPDKEN